MLALLLSTGVPKGKYPKEPVSDCYPKCFPKKAQKVLRTFATSGLPWHWEPFFQYSIKYKKHKFQLRLHTFIDKTRLPLQWLDHPTRFRRRTRVLRGFDAQCERLDIIDASPPAVMQKPMRVGCCSLPRRSPACFDTAIGERVSGLRTAFKVASPLSFLKKG